MDTQLSWQSTLKSTCYLVCVTHSKIFDEWLSTQGSVVRVHTCPQFWLYSRNSKTILWYGIVVSAILARASNIFNFSVMNIYWQIYLLGFAIALFYLTYQFIEYCVRKRIDYRRGLMDFKVLGMIVLDSLGSWLTVVLCWLTRDAE